MPTSCLNSTTRHRMWRYRVANTTPMLAFGTLYRDICVLVPSGSCTLLLASSLDPKRPNKRSAAHVVLDICRERLNQALTWRTGDAHLESPFKGYWAVQHGDPVRTLLTMKESRLQIKIEHACRMTSACCPSFFGLGLKDGHVLTFWLLL